jgi:predicted lipoprotein
MAASSLLDATVTTDRSSPRWRLRSVLPVVTVAVVCVVLLALGVTIVPDSDVAKTDLNGNPTFEARQYVDSLWSSRVLPLVQDKAVPIATVLDALAKDPDAAGKQYGHRLLAGDGPWNFIVRGEGQIKTVETQLRHATLTVDADGHDVVLQLGPVIFGTALRDGLPFVSFDQVVNQIQFAQVSRELNDRAAAAARTGLDLAKLTPGTRVAFAGAMTATQPPQVTLLQLHPMAAAAP